MEEEDKIDYENIENIREIPINFLYEVNIKKMIIVSSIVFLIFSVIPKKIVLNLEK